MHLFMTPLTAIAAQLCVLRPQPGSSLPCPSNPRAQLEPLGIWAYGASSGRRVAHQREYWAGLTSARKTDRPCHFVQEQAEDIFVPPLLRICLTLYYISLFWLLSPPPLRNSGPYNSFDYLGHSKNVDDDDDDCKKHWKTEMIIMVPDQTGPKMSKYSLSQSQSRFYK